MPRLLLVEDDDALRELYAELLAEAGHVLFTAGTGAGGLEILRRERPDLVLCDVGLPDLDGYGVLEAVRSDPVLAPTPFLFLTGLADKAQVRAGMAQGADDYLTKPVSPDELVAAVAARLARHDATRESAERRVDEMRRSLAVLLPHELRTPLTAILGGARMIQSFHREMPPEQIEEMAGAIVSAGQRLHRMAENYLLCAELELQRLADPAAAGRPLHGSAGAADVEAAARERAAEVGRGDDVGLALDDLIVPTAPAYLRKIVSELVDNACKFSQAGTPVRVLLRDDQGPLLEVADSGRGMSQQQLDDIGAFRQFDRAEHEQQGSGLGLALVKGLANGSGGHLSIESRPDAGTRVRVRWTK